jgi:hypothetical protein
LVSKISRKPYIAKPYIAKPWPLPRASAAHGRRLGRALAALGDETELDRRLPPLAEPRRGLVDLRQRRQARLVAEMLDRMRRRRARELEVLLPLGVGSTRYE